MVGRRYPYVDFVDGPQHDPRCEDNINDDGDHECICEELQAAYEIWAPEGRD